MLTCDWFGMTDQENPYVMMHYGKNYTGNDRFYGFCVDLLERIARDVGFDYILDLVPDRKYGAQDPFTGEWNGMVLHLMKHVGPEIILHKTKIHRCSSRKHTNSKLSLPFV